MGAFFVSCSVENNTAATRNFHNLTSHYNIYFNAKESYKEGLMRAQQSFRDDYTSVLPLFMYEDETVQQGISPQMRRAIDKATKVITFHSITAKPKIKEGRQTEKDKAFYDKNEYNKWIDDCFLLIGKAYMYQGEFFKAAESFKHVINNFPEQEGYYAALVWLLRTYVVIEEMEDAEELLVRLQDIEDFPEKFEEELYTTFSDYYIHREDYKDAALFLEKALKTRPKKNNRIRYTYILAQLYKEAGNGEASINNYRKVIKMNPPYVMAFNAKVSMAGAFQSGAANSNEIKKLLFSMLKDSKNDEYQDQIYYALGNIFMEEGDREKAIEYYHMSVRTSLTNTYQKGRSCLTLAELYYKEPIYTLSAAYYDTAVNLLNTDFPNYNNLSLRSRSLNNLVGNIQTFELQDSVQRLAKMSDEQRLAVIDGIIQDVISQEEEARRRQQEAMEDLQFSRSGMLTNTGGYGNNQQGGKWYFYNLNAKSFGQPEFRMKWGERRLEDNWRRSNKQSLSDLLDVQGTDSTALADGEGGAIVDNKSREYYLRNIPMTDSAMDVSNRKLEEALYNMGMIYRNDLLDYQKAIEALEELIERYPDGNYTMASYYYLHDLYNNVQNPSKANQYKELLSTRYPDSHMAKLLTNPNYINELEAEERKVETYYESVFTNFSNNNYQEVIRLVNNGLQQFTDEAMISKLTYMRALSIGALNGKESLKTELDTLIAMYPDSEVASEAKEIIDYMYVAFPVIKEAEQAEEAKELYVFNTEAPHRFMFAVRVSQNYNLVNFNLLNYNLDNFNAYDLKIEIKELGVDYNVLSVTGLSSYEAVSRYMEKVTEDISEIMGEMSPDLYEVVMISEENYRKLLETKEVNPYLLFYRENYPQ